MIRVRLLNDDEHAWAAATYRAIDFVPTPAGDVGVVAELDGARVGLGRLVTVGLAAVELGGIWTDESARHRGVARAIVADLIERAAGREIWCVPFEHLVAFYESFGMTRTPPPWPAAIEEKVDDCVTRGLPPIAVLRLR